MFTRERTWNRWAAPRADLVAAARLAAEEFERWDGVRPGITVRIVYAHGLTEEASDIEALANVHPTDLRRIETLWIDVRPNYREVERLVAGRLERAAELRQQGKDEESESLRKAPSPDPKSRPSFRVTKSGLALTVEGENRTNIEGLSNNLSEILTRQASWPTWFPAEAGLFWLFPFGVVFFFGGLIAAISIEGGTSHHHTHRLAGFLAWLALTIIGLLLGGILAWAFPAPEILDDGEQSRFRRARTGVASGIVAVVLGVVSIVVYAVVH